MSGLSRENAKLQSRIAAKDKELVRKETEISAMTYKQHELQQEVDGLRRLLDTLRVREEPTVRTLIVVCAYSRSEKRGGAQA